jgi:(p)ppGpp synthase/HD superfamily hydrolase
MPGMSPQLQSLSLKSMDSSALTLAVLDAVKLAAPADADRVFAAVSAAAFLHRNQTRSNRGNLPRTPYIEHPLRGTMRLIRWGVTDPEILIASLLHDTIEDCSEDIVRHFLRIDPMDVTDIEMRRYVTEWMTDTFGARATRIVLSVTNPAFTPGATRQQKNAQYVAHVREAITDRAEVFLVKFSDFVDNACGLPHNNVAGNEGMVSRLASKYLPLVAIFQAELASNLRIADLISLDGFDGIGNQIDGATGRLAALV